MGPFVASNPMTLFHRHPVAPASPSRARWARLSAVCALALATLPAQAIVGGTATNAFVQVGNGVQVSADWVFTAQHAALNPGQVFGNGLGSRVVAARFDAPGSGIFPAHDFSLMRLVSDGASFASLAVHDSVFAYGVMAPLAVTIVSAGNHPPARGFGFTTVSESLLMIDPDDSGPLGPVTVNFLISHDPVLHVQGGDSGGGLFGGHVADSSVLLGITSALITDEQFRPLGSGFVQPAAYRSWIDQTMAADLSDNQTVVWVSSVPEPATWALWALGVLTLAGLAARRQRAAPASTGAVTGL